MEKDKIIIFCMALILVGSGVFVLANHGGNHRVSPNCESPNNEIEVFFAYNIHPTYTGYATTLVAGRCEKVRFTSFINDTTGNLGAKIRQDIDNEIQLRNITFNIMNFDRSQKVDGRGKYIIP